MSLLIKGFLTVFSFIGLSFTTKQIVLELNALNLVSLVVFAVVFAWGAVDIWKRLKSLVLKVNNAK